MDPHATELIITHAISFKDAERDPLIEAEIATDVPPADRAALVADLARKWERLRRTAPAERRIVLLLANDPDREARKDGGAGLDAPAAVIRVLRALAAAGYRVADIPADGDALMARLLAGPTDSAPGRPADETFPRSDYGVFFAGLPRAVQDKMQQRWGPPERDPCFREADLDCGHFAIPAVRFGNVAVALEPARGDAVGAAQGGDHDWARLPRHGYLAFLAWIADGIRAHAVVRLG